MQGAKEDLSTVAVDTSTVPHVDDPDSDVDSWERAGDSDSEDEEDIPQSSHEAGKGPIPPPTAGDIHAPIIGGGDSPADIGDSKRSDALSVAVTGGSENNAIDNQPDPDRSGAGVANFSETNPFRRKMSLSGGQNNIPRPPDVPPPLPPSENLSKLSLNDPNINPWQPALPEQHVAPSILSTVVNQEPDQDIWGSQVPSRASSTGPASKPPAQPIVTPDEKVGWGDDLPESSFISVPTSFHNPLEHQALEEGSHAWDDVETQGKGKAPASANEESWNLIDNEPVPVPSVTVSQPVAQLDEKTPSLPPRLDEKPPAPPPRTPVSGKTETYQVKNINWADTASAKSPRKSPILVQNANGPCPLMALVNALTLTTPGDTALVNALRSREQISLDLLLDVVFDELMSERRTPPDQTLPDVIALYDFLKGLHTGMNVNPRFIPTEETEKAFKRTSLTHLHPTERGDLIPGTFEETTEISFYRLFHIPLIHGWLPSKSDPVHDAMKRHAETYEDAQNILFREEELEDKLSSPSGEGLTEEEQGIYQDVLSIKSFLDCSATQLTPWGLEVITRAMRPGSVAILFRNDHFSTLYRHPQTQQIFVLVTDAGYAGHAEVVWESLVDVNGERSEFFSGDFRVVGGPSQNDQYAASGSSSVPSRQGDWTTVQGKGGKGKSQSGGPLSSEEQEDRDLALALQLQEEEDQRHRAEQAQRRRETELSEQFIEQQSVRLGPVGLRSESNSLASPSTAPTGRRPSTGASRGGANTGGRGGARPVQQHVRPLVPPVIRPQTVSRPADEDDDDAPPSYEDAAKDLPYNPPAGHPSHPESSPNPSMNSPTTPSSMPRLPGSRAPGVAGVPRTSRPMSPPMPMGYRRGGGAYRPGMPPTTAGPNPNGRDKDCVVM